MARETCIRFRLTHARRWGILFLVFFVGGTLPSAAPVSAHAANIVVNVTNDELNVDGDCSLREAIQAANTDSAVSGCLAGSGADTITVPPGTYRLRRVGAKENGNATGDLDVLADVTILGAGGYLTVIDGNATDRVLHVLAGTVVVEDVVFQNGLAPRGADGADCINDSDCDESAPDGESGGGILTNGGTQLTLRRVVVENNASGAGGAAGDVNCPTAGAECKTFGGGGGDGGGVLGNGALTIEQSLLTQNRTAPGGPAGALIACGAGGDCFTGDSGDGGDGGGVIIGNGSLVLLSTTVTDNQSADWAGGVYCTHGSTCTIRDSTIEYNQAANRGGGLTGTNTTATVVNTTLSANTGNPGGGVALFSGTMNLDFVTIAGNSAGSAFGGGGGIHRSSGTLTMRNSIVADNTNTGGAGPNCAGIVTSGGYNHVESLTGCSLAFTTGDVSGVDPALQGLADNGGSTETQALSLGSAALDAIPVGTNGCGSTVVTDQRSAVRPTDGDDSSTAACDKGAFEREGAGDCPAIPPVCETAAKSKLLLKDETPDAGKDSLKWTFQGGSTELTQADLGDPTSATVYDLCLYSGSLLRAAMRLDDSSKWLPVGLIGYKYKDSAGSAGGITGVKLQAGVAGKTKVSVKGKGDNLPDPLPLSIPPNLTVVVRNSSTATCFRADYSSATTNEVDFLKVP